MATEKSCVRMAMPCRTQLFYGKVMKDLSPEAPGSS